MKPNKLHRFLAHVTRAGTLAACLLGGALASLHLLPMLPASSGVAATEANPTPTRAGLPIAQVPGVVIPNRELPQFTPVEILPTLSAEPSDDEIGKLRLFPQQIVPVEKAAPGSLAKLNNAVFGGSSPAAPVGNKHVLATLQSLQQATDPGDLRCLEAFVGAFPTSKWNPSLRLEKARRLYNTGFFVKATAEWQALWDELKDRREAGAVSVADEALGHLLDACIGLGQGDRLGKLVGEQGSRPGNGVLEPKLARARQSVWLLKHRGAQNVMCGPLAIYSILNHQSRSFVPIRLNDVTDDHIATGISLAEVKDYASHYNLGLVMARRPPGAAIPTPAVMHLASGHYSSLLEQEGGKYWLEDKAMQFGGWVPLEAIEGQASGYFLIPSGPMLAGWRPVAEAEGGRVFGRDGIHGGVPPSQSVTDNSSTTAGGDGAGDPADGSACGMPRYTLLPKVAAIRINDVPVGYTPPAGPPVYFAVAYNDLDDSKPASAPTFSNIGRLWSIRWIAYVDHATSPLIVHISGGGVELYNAAGSTNYAPNDFSFATVTRSGASTYTRFLPDGSREVYNAPDNPSTPSRVFLTQTIDPAGNALTFRYDSNMRLVAVTDAIGQVTTLAYSFPGNIWKVTAVTDPFGRVATMAYNANGNLSTITDVIGLTSRFAYDSIEFVTSMTTPYGPTTFTKILDPTYSWNRTVVVTDPLGQREQVQFVEPVNVPDSGPALPTSIAVRGTNVSFFADNARLSLRNSYYWSKKAMSEAGNAISAARNYRWFTDVNYLVTPVLEAIKEPFEERVWFNYPGQPIFVNNGVANFSYYPGQGSLPQKTMRIMPDGTPQLTQTYYNALGKLSNSVDPIGRTTTYTYASNQVDLLEIRQVTGPGASERMGAFTYSSQHLVLTSTDAAGQTTTNTYNARGQLLTTTNPKNETTTLNYDTNGYLLFIDGPLPGTNHTTSFTYDIVGRVQSVTGPEGYRLAYGYDNLDRLTNITYPDGTFQTFTYDKLDRVKSRDRMGRETVYSYDSLRHLTSVRDPLNRVTRFEYCGCGALSSLVDPMGRRTSWDYDIQGRKIAKNYVDGSRILYTYENTTSRLKSVQDEKGQVKIYDYYPDGNRQQVWYPVAQIPTPTVKFTYDSNYDRMISMQDGIGLTTWSYYPAGVLGALKVAAVDGPWENDTINYYYDSVGRVINRSISGVPQTLAYDALGRTTNIVNALGSFNYAYDGATARVRDVAYPNGQTSHYDYFDNLGDRRLQRITHAKADTSIISRFTYAYNPFGNITNWVQEMGAITETWSIGYDDADQLLSVLANQGRTNALSYDYGYDLSGNRLFEGTNGVPRSFTYNALNELVSSSDVNATNTIYEWDAEQRLVAFNRGTRRSEFTYDGLGRRVRIVEKANGVVQGNTCFLWCETSICEARDSSGATVVRRLFPQGEAIVGSASSTNYFCNYSGQNAGEGIEAQDF